MRTMNTITTTIANMVMSISVVAMIMIDMKMIMIAMVRNLMGTKIIKGMTIKSVELPLENLDRKVGMDLIENRSEIIRGNSQNEVIEE